MIYQRGERERERERKKAKLYKDLGVWEDNIRWILETGVMSKNSFVSAKDRNVARPL